MSSTADVARPSALREASCERCAPVIARLFLSLALQPLPPGEAERRVPDKRPFARTLNGQTPPRYSPLDSGSPRNNLGLARSPLGPRVRGNDIGEGVRRLACFRWRSQQYAPRPSPTATTVFVTGFRQRFARPYRRLSRLVAGTAGGSCVGDPVSSRSLPVYPIQLSFFLPRVRRLRDPRARRFFVFGALVRWLSDRRLMFILLHMLRESSLNRRLRGFMDWWDFVGCVNPLRLASLAASPFC